MKIYAITVRYMPYLLCPYLKLCTSLQMMSGTVSSFTLATVDNFSLFPAVVAVEDGAPPSESVAVGCDDAVVVVDEENSDNPIKKMSSTLIIFKCMCICLLAIESNTVGDIQ